MKHKKTVIAVIACALVGVMYGIGRKKKVDA